MIRRTIKHGPTTMHQVEYSDYDEMIQRAIDPSLHVTEGGWESHEVPESRLPKPDSWDFGLGWDGAVKMATTDGWPEGLERLRAAGRAIESCIAIRIHTTQVIHDTSGASVDIGAFMTGEPECFISHEPDVKDGHGRVVTIAVQTSINAGVIAKRVETRGAAVLALVDMLELAGYQADLLLISSVAGHKRVGIEEVVPVKQAGRVLDPGRMAFALMHPAAQRRISFSCQECRSAEVRRNIGIVPHSTYGHPAPFTMQGHDHCDIEVPSLNGSDTFLTAEWATTWVLGELGKYGVVLEAEDTPAPAPPKPPQMARRPAGSKPARNPKGKMR